MRGCRFTKIKKYIVNESVDCILILENGGISGFNIK